MFGLGTTAVFDIIDKEIVFSTEIKHHWKAFFHTPSYWGLLLIFLPILYSGFYSENTPYWLERIRIKLPFLVLPLAYFFQPILTKVDYRKIGLFYIVVMGISAIGVTINYGLHFDHINQLIGMGHNIPVPRNHIRFSLGIAIATLLSLGLFFDPTPIKKWQKKVGLVLFILLFSFQHLLAVRSGLAGLYVGLLVLLLYSIFSKKHYKKGLLGILAIIAIPYTSIQTIPSLRAKVGYMKYDWSMSKKGEGENYSDHGRILSMQLALDIGRQHTIWGVGAGDIKDNMKELLESHHYSKILIPHNEYLFYFAATGLVGLIFLILGLFFPLLLAKSPPNAVFLSIQAILLISFFVEPTLETSTGVGYYLLWTLLGLRYINNDS